MARAALIVLCAAACVCAASSQTTTLDSLAAQVSRLVQTSTQLQQEVAKLTTANNQLRSELQSTRAQATADVGKLERRLSSSETIAKSLARQVSTQQLFVEERIRSDGHSGVKRNRGGKLGTKAYYSGSVISGSAALSVHDHSNYDRTIGLGEFIGVLNGVEFRTRHNDYRLVMPSTVSKAYQATEPIPFPEIPPQVLAKKTPQEQIAEMREWFRAWKFQDPKIRSYNKYFKAALCYLEGTWTQSTNKIDEPFSSDRHAIDASSWFDLQEKIAFTSYTGRKNNEENYAFLPTKIIEFTNDTIPIYAQWNYRILCHPISFDLPFKALQPVDDIATRMKLGLPYQQLQTSRATRFVVGPDARWRGDNKALPYNSLLDKIMREIPGLNNYGANLTDDVMWSTSKEPGKTTDLNAAYYHRWMSTARDAMGQSLQSKGFNDANLYVAVTTQPKVVPKSITTCFNKTMCKTYSQRVSYAIPLEILYLTPLHTWNPYNLAINKDNAVTTARGKRNGKPTPELAYNGTSSQYYYLTPDEFFAGGEVEKNDADTTKSSVAVLDTTGVMRNMSASGVRVLFPEIPGVGVLRQRYPIFPIHEEGSHTYQELEALKELLMNDATYGHLLRNPMSSKHNYEPTSNASRGVTLVTSVATKPSPHEHLIELDADEIAIIDKGGVVDKFTSEASGHSHALQIRMVTSKDAPRKYVILQCDGRAPPCWDGHESVKEGAN